MSSHQSRLFLWPVFGEAGLFSQNRRLPYQSTHQQFDPQEAGIHCGQVFTQCRVDQPTQNPHGYAGRQPDAGNLPEG
ncbi:MAG TPA: hypothetical protein VK888_03480, partial [Anaerolineales bacterium]|nr:hypothetical protein [Anaerolineales bacterium]